MSTIMVLAVVLAASVSASQKMNPSRAKIVVLNPEKKIEVNAADMFHDEVEKRTRMGLDVVSKMPGADEVAILIGTAGELAEKSYRPAAGRLLRLLQMSRDRVRIDSDVKVATAPRYALRGHQFGHRPKTNSYDAWSLPMWGQYYRDMVVFGMSAIELIRPRSDDDDDSPHFPKRQLEMMVDMSQLAADYGLDVWIWYPAIDDDYTDEKTVQAALAERGEVFRSLSKIDAVFVPIQLCWEYQAKNHSILAVLCGELSGRAEGIYF